MDEKLRDVLELRRTAKEVKRHAVIMRVLGLLVIILIAIVSIAYAISYFYDKYGSRCEILTGIPKEKRGVLHAGSDKISWMRRMLASDITVNIVYSEDKPQYCRGKGYILIDDTQDNIAQWEAAGGTGIVHVSAPETMAWLKSLGVL